MSSTFASHDGVIGYSRLSTDPLGLLASGLFDAAFHLDKRGELAFIHLRGDRATDRRVGVGIE
jgi:hypothetical protein